MAKISLLLPTRERLAKAQAFLQTVVATADDVSQIEVIVTLDDDDTPSHTLTSPHEALSLRKVIGPQTTMGALNTRCLKKATGEILMLVNDDILIRTKGWDTYLIEAVKKFPDGICMMHTRDGYKDASFPLFPILTQKAVQLIQDPYPSEYCGDCIDSHLFDIFLRLKDLGEDRIVFIPEVLFEHMHFSVGKAPVDALYQRRSRTAGNQTFYSYWKQREQIAQVLLAAIRRKQASLISLPFKRQNSYFLLLKSFWQSQQTLNFRLKYFAYHLLRETYIRFRLDKVKAHFKKP
ncbi:glycosyltransferase family 2 protein [Simkania sp.]|uniref:glycosyltransferase family 2 protein n=1 Tax=Simkania sp. TaxID=34094 RepID=UPI003B52B914